MEVFEGIVVRCHGGHYYVLSDGEVADCGLRGRLKRDRLETDLVAIGDHVRWVPTEEGRGIIEYVFPRRAVLSRSAPPPRPRLELSSFDRSEQETEQVIIANPDQVLAVFSVRNPTLNPFMVDRYLVACEAVQLPVVIVANKVDLLADEDDHDPLGLYQGVGYSVCYTSALTGEGLEALGAVVRGRLSVLTGPSGVGKSSLLNALWPHLDLKVGDVSEFHDRGKHITPVGQLLIPEPDTYIADTPGMRQFRFWDIDPEQLEAFFPEILARLGNCRFTPCTHTHEPDCAVREAVEHGEIAPIRYESYLRMFEHGF